MNAKLDKTNYWKKLADMGIRYGVEIVKTIEFSDGGLQPTVFEFNGANYQTAKEIYEAATK